MGSLRVYGISLWVPRCPPAPNGNRQARCIVAANQVDAAYELGISVSYLRNYGCATGNAEEIRAAMASPGVALWLNPATGEFERLRYHPET